jgi:hypothetical protein
LLGYRRGKREDFRQLRAAAAGFEPTRDLDARGAERRNHWSGGGQHLKAGSFHSTGWRIESKQFAELRWGEYEDARPIASAANITRSVSEDSLAAESNRWKIEKHFHSKHRFDFFIVVIVARLDRDRWEHVRQSARAAGGWYSRAWPATQTPGGFGFRTQEAALYWARNAGI